MENYSNSRDILAKLVSFPTVSRDTNLPLVEWVESYLESFGIPSERIISPCGTKAHLYAQTGPDIDGGVILSGHTDVVPVEGQNWTTDPWTLTERDGKLFGRGACDMKGFDALALLAMARASSRPLKRPLQLALSFDEEVGCVAVVDLVETMLGALPRAREVIVGEPTMMRVVTGHKGGLGYRVHVRGFEVHSSLLPYGVSAIMQAAKLIDWANQRNVENMARTPSELAAPFEPPFTTLHVGTIEGGTAHNITAKDCNFFIEFRFVPGESPEEWAELFEARAAELTAEMQKIHPDTGIDLTRGFGLPALTPETDGPAETLARRLTGDNGQHVVSYGTEGSQFQTRGYSTVICGPGDIAQAHQPDEFLSLDQLAAGEAFMDRLLDALCA
ncbi:acetylornithine deacetylase [Hoeflea ulvae]|uniref:Acetylornithine deacetylase n=1 Tax=Hoeflea ulvae TaxID=2983764 RepID=A0ABT3YDL6_9HYPH|nr:acetylornithine deacetylase [Hoeflea ulvae]MCY0093986.1 acetylornithine deacetylase [Hoeflea ulvae]